MLTQDVEHLYLEIVFEEKLSSWNPIKTATS